MAFKSALRQLSVAEACDLIDGEPENVFFNLHEFARWQELTPAQLRAELSSGRLRAHGTRDKRGGYHELTVSAKDALEWMVRRRAAN